MCDHTLRRKGDSALAIAWEIFKSPLHRHVRHKRKGLCAEFTSAPCKPRLGKPQATRTCKTTVTARDRINAVRGSKLHNGSFPKLLSERGIDFDEVRDTPAIEVACRGKSVEINNAH